MSIPNSVEELLQLIRNSGMVEEQELQDYLQRRSIANKHTADVREFAFQMVQDGVLTYFQSEQYLLGKWRGFTIGKYKLLERIGVGGMGQVFLCEHLVMKKRVAVKILPPAKADQPGALGRFYREARAAGCLDHANIVRTHDIDQDGNLHYIVMDYVDGANLLDVVKKFGPLSVDRAVSYTVQAADALDYAFQNKLIHRDIKPGNILVDRKGVARLLDMGLARFINDHTDQLTLKYDDKIVLGTADYVAPEQVANSHAVDIRADIYALGATLYFLLAGHPAFPTGTVSQKLLWHRTKEPTPIRTIRPEIPDELAFVIAKMMAKDPKARYQTPSQVATALAPFVPENVSLPQSDEMPELSPAAMAYIQIDMLSEPARVGNTSAARRRGHTPSAIAQPTPRASPAVALKPGSTSGTPSPFGASGNSPWGRTPTAEATPATRCPSPLQVPNQASVETPPARTETAPPAQHGPRNPFLESNPFAADASAEMPQETSWRGVIIAVAIVFVIATAIIFSLI